MKYYAVRKGHTTGIFTDWESCKAAVSGFKGAEYKSFPLEDQALSYLNNTAFMLPDGLYFDGGTGESRNTEFPIAEANLVNEKKEKLIDAALLSAVPDSLRFGTLSPRGTVQFEIRDGFTNNFAELYGCFLALIYAHLHPEVKNIYGDSALIIDWWSRKHVHVTDPRTLSVIENVAGMRLMFEQSGGHILKISGDVNPADLGYHKS